MDSRLPTSHLRDSRQHLREWTKNVHRSLVPSLVPGSRQTGRDRITARLPTNREWANGTDKMCRLAKSRALLPRPLDVQRLLTFDMLASCQVPPGASYTAGNSLRMLWVLKCGDRRRDSRHPQDRTSAVHETSRVMEGGLQ